MIRKASGVWCIETAHTGYYLAERGPSSSTSTTGGAWSRIWRR